MSPINVGGDGSVRWEVDVKKARFEEVVGKPDPIPAGGVGHYINIGVDDAVEDPYRYTIVIKIPKDQKGKAMFLESLKAALETALRNPDARSISFQLPVEDRAHGGPNHNQIHIRWD